MRPEDQNSEDAVDRSAASRCEHCGSRTEEDLVRAAFWSDRGLIAIEDVPARVCRACGEQSYDRETARRIEKLVAGPVGEPKQEILVPVFSLADVELPDLEGRAQVVDEKETEAVQSVFSGREETEEATSTQGSDAPCLCTYCESETDEGAVKSVFWTAQGLIAVESIPARVCRRCREQFYDEETAWKIAALTQQGLPPIEPNRRIVVPVFSLADDT
ncbi:MAG TPA: YgiT-type zinc finger protein [Thermoguttaceae bacterium]|nr:YgiT-type zinc finger protein [Thermoguttaceae bacterium]